MPQPASDVPAPACMIRHTVHLVSNASKNFDIFAGNLDSYFSDFNIILT